MTTHPTNAAVLKVERPGSYDRYGRSRLSLVEGPTRGWIEKTPRQARTTAGDVVSVDAALVLPKRIDLRPKDVVMIDNDDEDRYEVFDADETLDVLGQVLFRTYGLTRIRKDS